MERNTFGLVSVTVLDYLTQFHSGRGVLSTVASLCGQLQQCNSAARVMGRNQVQTHFTFWPGCPLRECVRRRHSGCATSLFTSCVLPLRLGCCLESQVFHLVYTLYNTFSFRKVLTVFFLSDDLLFFSYGAYLLSVLHNLWFPYLINQAPLCHKVYHIIKFMISSLTLSYLE